MIIASKVLLGCAAVTLSAGYYNMLQERKMMKEFSELEKVPTLDFDYVNLLDDIPKHKLIAICADPDTENSYIKKSLYSPKKSTMFSLVAGKEDEKAKADEKKTKKQVIDEMSSEEPIIITDHAGLPSFFLLNTKSERIRINFNRAYPTILFGLKPITKDIPVDQLKSPVHKNSSLISFGSPKRYQEIGLDPEEKLVYIGEVSPADANSHTSRARADLKMNVRYVLGEQKDFYLKHLDGKLVQYNRRVRVFGIATASLFICHLVAKQFALNKDSNSTTGASKTV